MKLLGVVLVLLASASATTDDFSAVADAPADIAFSALLVDKVRQGTAVGGRELRNDDRLKLRTTDIVAIRADVCGGVTNSMKLELYLLEDDGSEVLVREQRENFEPFTVFGGTPPDLYNGYTDFQRDRHYVLRAETYALRKAEGAVRVSKEISFSVQFQEKLRASDANADDEFGGSVAIDGDILVVGSSPFDGEATGSAYVFRRDAATESWSEVVELTASDAAAGDRYFGFAVAISQDTIVVGSYEDDDFKEDSGSA